ncbi:hypothetical protein [Nocardia sp. NPDC050435]|uniref:hypothetical protein n=1 Tax=Nocardia sp. NPDC050435 TaxID=3155040 RepID=UPI0033D2201C
MARSAFDVMAIERGLRVVRDSADPAVARVRVLLERAQRAGYRMSSSPLIPDHWELADAEDGAEVVVGSLEAIERWMDS